MSTAQAKQALKARLDAYHEALSSHNLLDPIAKFFSPDADFLTDQGLVRGHANLRPSHTELLTKRATADVVSTKWLADNAALVDSAFDAADGRGWSTELWMQPEKGEYVIRFQRIRAGMPFAFDALHALIPATIASEGVDASMQEEEAALRQQFKAFRAAFNNGDRDAMVQVWSEAADALPVFSFLNGRAQALNGRSAIGDKTDRMSRGAQASNPDPTLTPVKGAVMVSGEPKAIRFITPTLAVVDGTAEINDIPKGHGLVPSKMKGVYTDVWRKNDGKWQIESSRPWF